MKKFFKDLLISNYHFSKDEQVLMYRFQLLNSVLYVGLITLLLVGLVRINKVETFTLGVMELGFSMFFIMLAFLLKKNKKYFEHVSTIALVALYLVACSISLILGDDVSKMHWAALLIITVFLLKGYKIGLFVSLFICVTYISLYFIPFVDLSLTIKELVLTLLYYAISAIFLTFSELKHEKNRQNIKDINKELLLEMKIDSLSRLPNLLTLSEDLNKNKQKISLLYIYMDNFDTLAHAFGNKFSDKIIVNVSNVLKSFETEKIKLYHIELNRFAFVVSETFKDADIQFSKSICTVFEQVNIEYENTSIPISVLIGIARGDDESTILQAKTALNEVIEEGDIDYKLFEFDKHRQDKQNNDIYWLQNIKNIIQKDQLVVYYQPIIDNKTAKVSKYESLVRAIDKDKIISPFFFLDAAKSVGMIDNITRSVIEKSFNKFQDESYEFSINITQKDLNSDYFINYLIQKIDKYNINPNRVILEILENISSLESKQMLNKLQQLKDLGFQIAIDDFGAEASNFSRLLSIDANIIKIDAQFIKNIHTNSNSYKIVEAIVSLAKNLGAKTVAEFVHNEEVYEIVKKLGVDYSQGFFLGEPLPTIETKKNKADKEKFTKLSKV